MVMMVLLFGVLITLLCVSASPIPVSLHSISASEDASSASLTSQCEADTAALVKRVEYFGAQVKRKTRYVAIPSISIKTRVAQRRKEAVHRIFESLHWIRAHPKNAKFVDGIFDELPTIRRDLPDILSADEVNGESDMFLRKVFDEISSTADEMRRISSKGEECSAHLRQVIQLMVDDDDGILVNVISLMRIMLL